MLRVDSQDDESGMMHGVMVYDHTGGKGNTALMLADSALLKMAPGKDYLIFTLYEGANYQENNVKKYRDTTLELQRIAFSRQDLVIPLRNYSFEKSDSSRFGDQIKSQNVSQLRHLQDSLGRLNREQQDRHYRSLAASSVFALRNQLDTAAHYAATELFRADDFGRWPTLEEEAKALHRASDAAERLSSEISSYDRDVYEYNFYLNRADIELLKKYAQALACFILFFIGAPLGALIRKGGLGTSAIVSVLFFVLYWVVDISGTKLARDGAIDAFTGAFVSAYVLLPIGAFLTWKAVHDASLLSGKDALRGHFRKIWSRVSGFFRPVRIVYMGTPEFAVAPLDALVKARYKLVGVVTVADKPSGRGLKAGESAVKQYAVAHGIPVLQPLRLKDPEFLERLRALKADLFVVVAFRMLPEEVWSMPRLGTFNLHAALLPQYRGAAPINWAVINGERLSGVTTFMIDKDIDTGGIILREEYRLKSGETAGSLHDALMPIGAQLVLQTVEGLVQHNVETRVQRSFIQGSEILHPAPKLTRELCHLDWNDTSENLLGLIRGLSPHPAAFTLLQKEGAQEMQLKIFDAQPMDLHAPAGTVLSDGKSYLAIATADGALALTDLQAGGKKRMEARAFLAGFREPASWHADAGTSRAERERLTGISEK